MSTFDDEKPLEFFEEPETLESPERQRRRMRPQRPGGPRRPAPPPPGAVALARLAGFVALAIAVVVGLVFWVGSCQGKSKHDAYKSYMDKVQPIAQSSASTGTAALSKELNSNTKLTVAGLQAKLEQWSHQQQLDYDAALRLVPPAALQSAQQEVLATIQLRAIGLTGLANTLAEAGSKSAFQVADLMAKQAQLLTASDLVWAELFRLPATQTMKRAGIVGVIAPPSQLVVNPEVISAGSFREIYRHLHATSTSTTTNVTGLHGSILLSTEAVVGSTTKQLTSSSPTTVDVAASLVFKVSFKNAGNFDEANIPVKLTVTVFGKPVLKRHQTVSFVAKGQTATASFGNLQLSNSSFSGQATVSVVVGKVPGETNLTDNHASYPVFFSLPSSGG